MSVPDAVNSNLLEPVSSGLSHRSRAVLVLSALSVGFTSSVVFGADRSTAAVDQAIESEARSLPACKDLTMTYKYPGEGSIGERFQQSQWWRINSENAPDAVARGPAHPPEPKFPVVDCSTASLLCVRTYHRVFAVPRDKIEPGQKYKAAGADITIEGCLRSDDSECATALFISDCRSADDPRRNRVPMGRVFGKDCRATIFGQQILFIFDRQRGVIAYEPADWWQAGTDISRWDLSTLGVSAGFLALDEPRGLLACEMSSRN